MNASEKQEVWLQAFELLESFRNLNDDDLIACRDSLKQRAEVITLIMKPHTPTDLSHTEAIEPEILLKQLVPKEDESYHAENITADIR